MARPIGSGGSYLKPRKKTQPRATIQCAAQTKQTLRRCVNPAQKGDIYCAYHCLAARRYRYEQCLRARLLNKFIQLALSPDLIHRVPSDTPTALNLNNMMEHLEKGTGVVWRVEQRRIKEAGARACMRGETDKRNRRNNKKTVTV